MIQDDTERAEPEIKLLTAKEMKRKVKCYVLSMSLLLYAAVPLLCELLSE